MKSPKDKLKSLQDELLKEKELLDSLADDFKRIEGDRLLGPNTELEYRRMIKDLKESNEQHGSNDHGK